MGSLDGPAQGPNVLALFPMGTVRLAVDAAPVTELLFLQCCPFIYKYEQLSSRLYLVFPSSQILSDQIFNMKFTIVLSSLVAMAAASRTIKPCDWEKYPDTGCAEPYRCAVSTLSG